MKKLMLFMCWGIPVFAQVGIGTTTPTETLDINGTLKITTVNSPNNLEISSNNMLVTENSVVKKISTTEVISSALKSTIKGSCDFMNPVTLSLLSGSVIIPFSITEFDTNNEYDSGTYIFTAKQDGIYEIGVQIEMNSVLAAATNLGVLILKNGSIIQSNSCANINIAGVNYTKPIRQIKTVVSLVSGDEIYFELEGDIALGSVNLANNVASNFFSIVQVR